MLPQLDCLATLAKVLFRCLDIVKVPIVWGHARTKRRENICLSIAEVVVRAPSVISRPGSVDSAYGSPDSRRHLLSRSPQTFLYPLNHTSG